jgi:hypothetical protein
MWHNPGNLSGKMTISTIPARQDGSMPSCWVQPQVPVLDGAAMAACLAELGLRKREVLVVVNRFTGFIYERGRGDEHWQPAGRGELSDELLEASAALRQSKNMWWSIVDGSPAQHDPSSLQKVRATTTSLRRWLSEADDLTGREGEASQATRDEVACLAAWRCQFAGCGADLKTHGATGRRGRFSYYAHIVASSAKGPRGHETRSSLLADEPDNLMLLCDSCHRLVDRVDPDYYTVEMLQEMRRHSVSEVRRLLDTLAYPEVEVLPIIGSIAGQVPQFNMRDAEMALWDSRLRAARHEPEHLFQIGNQQHDVHAPDYWAAAFRTLRSDLVNLQRLLNGARRGGSPRPRLAVFPQHTTSVLLLAGRVLGENSGTFLFQPHRSIAAGPNATRWSWPRLRPEVKKDKFKLRTSRPAAPGALEATLLVSLTFGITSDRLPPHCAIGGDLKLPTLEVFVDQEDRGIHLIGRPEDHEELGRVLDRAIQILQDEWRVQKVHLFVGAPASAVVLIGQKMQARNQATFACYEARPGDAFYPTIEISGAEVREPRSGQTCSLQP